MNFYVPFNLATHPLELPAPDAAAPARLPPLPRASRRDSRKLGTGRRLAPPSAEHGEPLEARQADVFYHEMGVADARVLEQRPPGGGGGGGYRERRRDGRGGHSRISAEPRDSSHRKAAPGPTTAGEDCRGGCRARRWPRRGAARLPNCQAIADLAQTASSPSDWERATAAESRRSTAGEGQRRRAEREKGRGGGGGEGESTEGEGGGSEQEREGEAVGETGRRVSGLGGGHGPVSPPQRSATAGRRTSMCLSMSSIRSMLSRRPLATSWDRPTATHPRGRHSRLQRPVLRLGWAVTSAQAPTLFLHTHMDVT
ncbi:hypothetical protein PVAP13_7NG133768 [Panicum virgatum]|uniref:Uncharacterized protein n=1 Tax=Panicum virgatum TaxID=38727 RepID=A0A8T0Q5W8_PANVG|nr:hypothetical protein PVAP13_7NG133768 [Panicum virgatum]